MPHFPALELGPRFGPLFTTLTESPCLQGRKSLRNVTCFCKSQEVLKRKFHQFLRVLKFFVNIWHLYLQGLHVIQTSCSLSGSKSVGCRRSASWHDPSASDDRKGTTKNCCKKHKWNGFLRYMNVLSNCHLYNIPVCILIYVIIVFILFNWFFFYIIVVCGFQRSRLLLSLGHLRKGSLDAPDSDEQKSTKKHEECVAFWRGCESKSSLEHTNQSLPCLPWVDEPLDPCSNVTVSAATSHLAEWSKSLYPQLTLQSVNKKWLRSLHFQKHTVKSTKSLDEIWYDKMW